MIAAKHMDPLVGVDVHIIMIPSPAGPIPTPLPHPYVGMVFDPMDYVPILGATVMINGLPRGLAGSSGQALPPHIPMGGPFMKPPSNESEIFMGSATVVVDGDPQSFLALPVLSCQDVGMPAPPRAKKKSVAKSLMLPTTVVLCVPMGPLVMIGGPPTISMMAMAMKGVMAGLKKLKGLMKASKKVKKLSDKIHKAANKLCDKLKIGDNLRAKVHKGICSVTGHPVDIATGKVFTDQIDFRAPGALTLDWERTWYSTSTYRGPLGHGWHHSLDLALHVTNDVLLLRTGDGRHVPLPGVDDGEEYFDRKEKLTLRRVGSEYRLHARDGLVHVFAGTGSLRRLVRIEDPHGDKLTLAYDGGDRLTEILDCGGRPFRLHYDRNGLLQQIEGPHPDDVNRLVVLARYEYDRNGDLVFAHDALGQTTRYEYRNHLLTRETNRNSLSFYFEYDGTDEKARCIHTWGDGGIYERRLTYQARVTVVQNSLGHKTTYHHRDGLVWKTVDALGAVTETERNQWNEIVKETDALGQITEIVRDERGNVVSERAPDGGVVRLSYDAEGRPLSLIGPAGGQWKWSYDPEGRLVERIDAVGRRTRYRWSGPRLTGVTDPAGGEMLLDYDVAGNLSLLRTPDGGETRWTFDRLGRSVRKQDPAGNVEIRQFDLLGRAVRVEEPDGNIHQVAYDGEGNVVRAKNRHYDVELKYGGMNRLVSRTQGGTTVRFGYDTEDNLVHIYNEAGAAYRFVRGPTGEVMEEHGFDGLRRQYERDLLGRLRKTRRPGGNVTENSYDGAGRLVGRSYTDANGTLLGQESYLYRADGELLRADNGTCAVSYERDLLGRVRKETQGDNVVESEYGPLSLRTRMKTNHGHVLEIDRNPVGEVLAMRAGGGSAVPRDSDVRQERVPDWEAHITRDQLGLELDRHLPGGVRSRWVRDKVGRPLNHYLSAGARQLSAKSYSWDVNHRLQMIVDALHGPVQFSYDSLGNLTSAAYADGKVDLRMPDAVGNLFRTAERRDRRYGPSGQLLESWTQAGATRYTYDAEGNLALKVLPDGSQWKYEWNAAGLLAKVVRPDGRAITFGYDALGRRVWKKYQNKTTRWVWDNHVPVHEWVELDPGSMPDAPVAVVEPEDAGLRQRAVDLARRQAQGPPPAAIEHGSPARPITWVFDPESFVPAAKLVGEQRCSIITDHVGTPTVMLDADGNRVWSADISIYGDLRNVVGDKHACPFRWPGQYEDEETGLYYNRFRYYDPDAGEYLSQDPLGTEAGLKAYAYPFDPLAWVDVFGLVNGGSYSEVRRTTSGGEVHHMPANSVRPSGVTRGQGPAIAMDTADHYQTASRGSGKDAKLHRATQADLISKGKYADAMEMDILDIKDKFGNKYDDAMKKAIDYAHAQGRISADEAAKLKGHCK